VLCIEEGAEILKEKYNDVYIQLCILLEINDKHEQTCDGRGVHRPARATADALVSLRSDTVL